jgi:hypothetical protein
MTMPSAANPPDNLKDFLNETFEDFHARMHGYQSFPDYLCEYLIATYRENGLPELARQMDIEMCADNIEKYGDDPFNPTLYPTDYKKAATNV